MDDFDCDVMPSPHDMDEMGLESPMVLSASPSPRDGGQFLDQAETPKETSVQDKDKTQHSESQASREGSDKQVTKAIHTVKRLEKQRRPSNITVLGALVKQLFMEKKIAEDGVPVQVVDNLFLGSIGAAMNVPFLSKEGISHILCVANQIKPKAPEKFVYKTVDILDAPDCPILEHFDDTFEFIESALSKGKILVHWLSKNQTE
ncbi:hypothetical protein RFI_06377 [Reticulomyxa filosa]|uniref:Uncharacterized protein n=1 Tax=Reticulomyxa filosa TaxID=46433 RepID=X6NWP8_RETFI|nr:hypothetical protein RFI_06377 [Reticulomyxa filosa]|eukprot:ETO30745.1 hypothetical protein RFI_06377 [Reticulomyxa filosa]